MKTACITGITGQTGSVLARKLLLEENFKVYGLIRKSSSFNTERIEDIFNHPNLDLSYGDLTDSVSINNFVKTAKPDYFFNMGAISHVKVSYDIPSYVNSADAVGVLNCLEAIRLDSPNTRFLQASTSELFGTSPAPQSELTPMAPTSPYGCAKLYSYWMTINYRRGYNLFAVNSISFNHESKYRSPTFLTRKCTQAAARIKMGLQDKLVVGNLNAKRSWNHVNDIIDGMMLMIRSDIPKDYVIGSNDMISVQQFIEKTFSKVGLDWTKYVETSEKYLRPVEVPELQPDASLIKKELGWSPKYNLDDIIDEMLQHDLKLAEQELLIKNNQK